MDTQTPFADYDWTWLNGNPRNHDAPTTLPTPRVGRANFSARTKSSWSSSAWAATSINSVAGLYLFPLSAEIGKKDAIVEFNALIGRVHVMEHFNVEEMQFQGQLQF